MAADKMVTVKIIEEKYLRVDDETAADLVARAARGRKDDREWVEEVVGDYDSEMTGHKVLSITEDK